MIGMLCQALVRKMQYFCIVKHKIRNMNMNVIIALVLVRILTGVLMWRYREMIISRFVIAQKMVSAKNYVMGKLTESKR